MYRLASNCKDFHEIWVMLCGRVPAANAPGCTVAWGLMYKPWSLIVPTCTARCLHPSSERRNYLGKKWPVVSPESCDFHAYTFGLVYMPQICDMGQTALLPLRRKACWGFFRPEKSDGFGWFEPANLGTKGQHATSKPPKPLYVSLYGVICAKKHGLLLVFCKQD